MTYKDYYKILGIGKNASTDEVKKAYRKLAIKYHPDKNKGDKSAEDRFKEINEANEVLSDPEKRKKYDTFGEDWRHYQASGGNESQFDWSRYARQRGGPQEGNGDQDFGSFEFRDIFGGQGASDFFETLFGRGPTAGAGRRTSARKGQDAEAELPITLEEAYNGATKLFELNGQTIRIRINPGMQDKQVLRLGGKGSQGSRGGQAGDLFLSIRVLPHPEFERKGNDLYHDLPVPLYTAVLGGKVEVNTLKGTVKVDIQPGTQNGQTLRLAGLGMPVYNEQGRFGDLYARTVVQIPTRLSQEEQSMFQKLAELQRKG
jgi:curved DNA-binding protein